MTSEPFAKSPAPPQQSGAIPFRWNDGRLEVLLITSRRRRRWIIPKGMIEHNWTPALSAAREAYEEAGVRGALSARSTGSYVYEKLGRSWMVEVFALAVHTLYDRWPEDSSRERQWFPVEQAASLVEEPDLQGLIARLPAFVADEPGGR